MLMNITGYTTLFSSIVTSAIWRFDDKTRIVWITMLALADRNGMVKASVPFLADMARVSRMDCDAALYKLSRPGEDRVVEQVDGGWFMVSYGKYRPLISADQKRERMKFYMREYRARVRA